MFSLSEATCALSAGRELGSRGFEHLTGEVYGTPLLDPSVPSWLIHNCAAKSARITGELSDDPAFVCFDRNAGHSASSGNHNLLAFGNQNFPLFCTIEKDD